MAPPHQPYRLRSGRLVDLSEWEVDDSEHVAESCEQGDIILTLLSSLRNLIRQRGWTRVRAAGDNYFAWLPERPQVRVSPDVYLLDDPPARLPKMWCTWLPGHRPPRWAVEIVSEDWHKDYDQVPIKYEELGCRELAVFDPAAALGETRNRRRVALTLYRRTAEGRLVKVHEGRGAVWSEQLEIWLLPMREGYSARLRLSEDEAGTRLVPTAEEDQTAMRRALDLQRSALEAEKVAREQERAALEAEKAAREQERASLEAEKAAHEQERAAHEQEKAAHEQEKAAHEQERAALEAEKAAHEQERAARERAEQDARAARQELRASKRRPPRGSSSRRRGPRPRPRPK